MYQKVRVKDVLTEEEWILRAKQDPAAFRALYESHFKRIFLFILYRVGDKDIAGDLAQQTFLNAIGSIQHYELRGVPFSAWLYRIALNQCHAYFRKTKRSRTIVLEDFHLENLADEIIGDQLNDWKEALPDVLGKLNENDLQIIELRFFEERSFREVGDILGITENLAKVKTYRILERMKQMFTLKRNEV